MTSLHFTWNHRLIDAEKYRIIPDQDDNIR